MAGDTGATFEGADADVQIFANLSGPLKTDLEKMAAAGSTEEVAVCVQYDAFGSQTAYRWVVPAARGWRDRVRPEPIGQVNTGEPGSLSEFIGWARPALPGRALRAGDLGARDGLERGSDLCPVPGGPGRDAGRAREPEAAAEPGGVFASSAGQIMKIEDDRVRGLCYDDSSRDFLDNRGLQQALADGARALGREKIDVLGLDACLMCMIEVAYQVRGQVGALVGAETVMPTDLWPWEKLLAGLQAQPQMGGADLALLMAGLLPAGPVGNARADRRVPGRARSRLRGGDGKRS